MKLKQMNSPVENPLSNPPAVLYLSKKKRRKHI